MRCRTLLPLILCATLVIGAAALIAAPAGELSTAPAWVRTTDGWERPANWGRSDAVRPQLHPFVVAGVQLCGSLWALLAFGRKQ